MTDTLNERTLLPSATINIVKGIKCFRSAMFIYREILLSKVSMIEARGIKTSSYIIYKRENIVLDTLTRRTLIRSDIVQMIALIKCYQSTICKHRAVLLSRGCIIGRQTLYIARLSR